MARPALSKAIGTLKPADERRYGQKYRRDDGVIPSAFGNRSVNHITLAEGRGRSCTDTPEAPTACPRTPLPLLDAAGSRHLHSPTRGGPMTPHRSPTRDKSGVKVLRLRRSERKRWYTFSSIFRECAQSRDQCGDMTALATRRTSVWLSPHRTDLRIASCTLEQTRWPMPSTTVSQTSQGRHSPGQSPCPTQVPMYDCPSGGLA